MARVAELISSRSCQDAQRPGLFVETATKGEKTRLREGMNTKRRMVTATVRVYGNERERFHAVTLLVLIPGQ